MSSLGRLFKFLSKFYINDIYISIINTYKMKNYIFLIRTHLFKNLSKNTGNIIKNILKQKFPRMLNHLTDINLNISSKF